MGVRKGRPLRLYGVKRDLEVVERIVRDFQN